MSEKIECIWKKAIFREENAPIERSSHAVSIIGGTLYVIGGENTARIPIDSTVYALDISNQNLKDGSAVWRKIEPEHPRFAPSPRIAHAQATIGKKIYIFGGRQGITMDESPLNDLHYFDTVKEEWVEVAMVGKVGNVPSPRSFHKMVSVGSSLFVFGGCGNDGRMSDLYEFMTEEHYWIKHSNEYNVGEEGGKEMIKGRGGASLIASSCGTKLFLVAGFAGKEMDDIYIYDIKLKTWTYLKDVTLPDPRSVCVSAGLQIAGKGNFVAIFGGEISESSKGHEGAGGFSNSLILINEETLEVTTAEPKNDENEMPL